MKYVYIIAILVIQTAGCNAQNKSITSKGSVVNDSIVYNRISQMDFSNYIEKKSIGDFLTDIGYSYSEHLYSTARPHYLQFIFFVFSDSLWLEIEPSTFEHTSIYNLKHKWDVEKLKKEKAGDIRLYYRNQCMKGCKPNHPNQ